MTAPARPGAWRPAVTARITRILVDVIEEIVFTDGVFTRRFQVVGGPSPALVVVLDAAARRTLLDDLLTQLGSSPAGSDTQDLRTFAELLEDSLVANPSHRFDHARFGTVTHDESRGVYFGHLGLGIDVVGTIRDDHGVLAFEQHIVPAQPGPFLALLPADTASLAAALTAYLRDNPGADQVWKQILDAAAQPAQPGPST